MHLIVNVFCYDTEGHALHAKRPLETSFVPVAGMVFVFTDVVQGAVEQVLYDTRTGRLDVILADMQAGPSSHIDRFAEWLLEAGFKVDNYESFSPQVRREAEVQKILDDADSVPGRPPSTRDV